MRGYAVRSVGLALNAKVHRGATAEALASVAAECGADVTGFAAYWERVTARSGSDELSTFNSMAFDDAHLWATEKARELFGKHAEVYTDGRSGGWLHVKGAPSADEVRDAEELVAAGETEARAVAWQACANGYLPEKEARERAARDTEALATEYDAAKAELDAAEEES